MSSGMRWPSAAAAAEDLLTLTAALETKLPGTKAALRDGIITFGKAQIIVCAHRAAGPGRSPEAEAMVLGRAGRLTPGGLRVRDRPRREGRRPRTKPRNGARKRPGTPGCSGGPKTPGTPP